jgi:hypothetical protein
MFAAVVGALGLSATAVMADATPEQRIAELEARVAQLQQQQAANSKDVAATIDSVLRDAERRSQLMAAGDGGAGYEGGFYIRSGDFELRPGAQFQFRNVTTYAEGDDDDGGDDNDDMDNGFEVRRMKFELSGTAFTQDLQYFFQWNSDRNGGSLVLEDAYVLYMFSDAWGLRAGQFKDPVAHEELTSSKRQLAVDRSLANEVLSGGVTDRVQGVTLVYGNYSKDNPINLEFGLHDGLNTDNTDFTEAGSLGWDFGMAGRVEFKAMGDWRDYRDFTAKDNRGGDLLVLGAGVDWTQNGNQNIFHGAIDAHFETKGGFNASGAVYIRHAEFEEIGGEDDATDWGAMVQAGILLNPSWELYGRVSFVDFDDDGDIDVGDDDDDEIYELTVGLNYYLGNNGSALHRAKITVDLSWLPEGTANTGLSESGLEGIGYIGTDDDLWVVRGQFQLLI